MRMVKAAIVAGALAATGIGGAMLLARPGADTASCQTRLRSGRVVDLGQLTEAECRKAAMAAHKKERNP